MYRVFNMGIGIVLVLKSENVTDVIDSLNSLDENAFVMGEIESGEKGVKLCPNHS